MTLSTFWGSTQLRGRLKLGLLFSLSILSGVGCGQGDKLRFSNVFDKQSPQTSTIPSTGDKTETPKADPTPVPLNQFGSISVSLTCAQRPASFSGGYDPKEYPSYDAYQQTIPVLSTVKKVSVHFFPRETYDIRPYLTTHQLADAKMGDSGFAFDVDPKDIINTKTIKFQSPDPTLPFDSVVSKYFVKLCTGGKDQESDCSKNVIKPQSLQTMTTGWEKGRLGPYNCYGDCPGDGDELDQNGEPPTNTASRAYAYPATYLLGFSSSSFRNLMPKPISVLYKKLPVTVGVSPSELNCDGTESPLIVDTDGSGIKLSAPLDGPGFDVTGDGERDQTSWPTKASNMFLALDRNGNGKIDNIDELFGNNTRDDAGRRALDGFEALRAYDDNKDGVIDAKDKIFDRLYLWSDINFDGKSSPSELFRLSEKGVASIGIPARGVAYPTQFDQYQNESRRRDSVVLSNGEKRLIVDVWFRTL